ncbi:MAG: glycosyltransferase family 4 protein [bacterium]
MKKILMVGPLPPPNGGMEIYTELILQSKLNEKYKFISLNTSKNKGINSFKILKYIFFIYNCIKIFSYCLIFRPDISHYHVSSNYGFWRPMIFAKISKLFGTKNIFHMHSGGFPKFYKSQKKKNKIKIKKTLKNIDLIIVPTKFWKSYYRKLVKNKKINVLPNSIDLKIISKHITKNKKNKLIQILYVGKINKTKGIYQLLNAFKKINNAKLAVMGSFQNNEKDIKKKCEEYKIEKKIKFIGTIYDDKRFDFFNESDIFIIPSYFECMPIVILEAMAFGLPIIATDVGGIPDIVKNKKNALLIKPKSSKMIYNSLTKLINDSKLRKILSKNNIKEIKKYDINNLIFKFDNLYKKL